MLFAAKWNVAIAEWSARVPSSHIVVRTCQNFEKHCFNRYLVHIMDSIRVVSLVQHTYAYKMETFMSKPKISDV
jgi:hypothetical protein